MNESIRNKDLSTNTIKSIDSVKQMIIVIYESPFYLYFCHKFNKMNSKEISIEQINKLDAIAFRLLYKDYYKALVCYANQLVQENSIAEDIVQELFSSLWEKKMPFKSLTSLRSYLYNSVRNASFDYLKHKDVESLYLQKVLNTHQPYKSEEESDDFFSEEIYRQLFRTIDELPLRCREIFMMHMNNQKNEEIAHILNISIETVKTQKKRAMSFLKKKLSPNQYLLLLVLLS